MRLKPTVVVTLALAITALPTAPASAVPTLRPQASASHVAKPTDPLKRLRGLLDCASTQAVQADMYNFSPAHGFNCYPKAGLPVVARKYPSALAMAHGLDEWQPVDAGGRAAIWGKSWFAIGPRSTMTRLSKAMNAHSSLHDSPPPLGTLTASQVRKRFCMGFVAAAERDFALDSPLFESQRADLERLFPGLHRFVITAVTPTLKAKLKQFGDADGLRFAAWQSTTGAAVHRFCDAWMRRGA